MKALKVVIVEDEVVTARNLVHVLQTVTSGVEVLATLESVRESVDWFNLNRETYDLAFMDIRLADGLSFDIFKKTEILKPVIFVTAYNEYALQAFKNNGIDYILKPFDEQEIERSIKKYRTLSAEKQPALPADVMYSVLEQISKLSQPYKRSFLLHFRDKLIPVDASKISWFYTEAEMVYAYLSDGRQFVMEFTMEQLDKRLDPDLFFRANRQFIINRSAITEVDFYFNSRLFVKVKPEPKERIIISKARVPAFKAWMNR